MEKIGHGSYGNVFFDESTNEAVKKCYHEDSRDIWAGNIREMDILKRCGGHPNIVTLNSVGIESTKDLEHNKLILRLKYYSHNLQSFMSKFKDNRVDISTIRIIIVQILLGLEYIHANKIIHRDLKPDNILINPDTLEVAICDFGMSEIFMRYKKSDSKVTAPLYRAPEVFKELYYSAEVDIWAVGLVFFSMIHGDCPYTYPLNREKKLLDKIHTLNSELNKTYDEERSPEISAKRRVLERKIKELKESIKSAILKEISTIDVKKMFSPKFAFRKLLEGLLREDPNKRMTATQALEDSFFDSVRAKYINTARSEHPPIPMKLQKLNIEDIPERKWISKYTMKYISENSDNDCYPVVFHGLDIFEKYLHSCRVKGLLASRSLGKYLNEKETYLYLYTCFYISHKFYAITEIPLDFEDFFPEDLAIDSNMEKAEDFEEYMLTDIINFKFFEYTLYEVAEEMINSPDTSDYYKILREYLSVTQKTQDYNSYRSLYREHILQKYQMN